MHACLQAAGPSLRAEPRPSSRAGTLPQGQNAGQQAPGTEEGLQHIHGSILFPPSRRSPGGDHLSKQARQLRSCPVRLHTSLSPAVLEIVSMLWLGRDLQ